MYYVVSLFLYFWVIVIFIYLLKSTNKEEDKKYRKELINFPKIYGNNIKDKIKNLKLKERVIYNLTIWLQLVGMFAMPLLIHIIRINLIVPPDNAITFEYSHLYSLFLFLGSVGCSPLIIVPLNHFIDKKHIVERVIGEPIATKRQDYLILSICLIISVPVVLLSMNTYRYANYEGLGNKGMFSLKEVFYTYDDFDYVLKHIYSDGKYDYRVILKNGKKMYLYDDVWPEEEEELLKVLDKNNIAIKEEYA